MKRYFLIIFVSILTLGLHAQSVKVTGQVTAAADKEPIMGAYVKVAGTKTAAITDIDGNFTIDADKNATLEVSMVGFQKASIGVAGRSAINIVMKDDVSDLNEVVVIGYGAVKKSDLTSSISAIKGDKLEKLSTGNVMNALQGQVNGVQITNSGSPGGTPRVIIRGVSTINGSDPLYVVDGMPVGNNINFLNQNDIESMQVLKDASAAAIYGTRGSNGVILSLQRKASC